MIYNIAGFPCSDELYHHGIIGQKWGVRRYQNPDGTYTAEGKRRRSSNDSVISKADLKRQERKEWKEAKRRMIDDASHAYKMTDAELLAKIGRLEKEKRLMELTYERLTTSGDPAKNIMLRSGKKFAENFVAGAGAFTVGGLVASKGNPVAFVKNSSIKEFSKWAFPNPNAKKK